MHLHFQGPIQFYLEAAIDVSNFGSVVMETFSVDVDIQVSSNYTAVSQSGIALVSNQGPPGILRVRVKTECEDNFFGPNCDVHCIPRDDVAGHYTCDMQGDRVCLPGYCEEVGNSCSEECDECADSPCLNGGNCIVSEFFCHY